MEIRGKTALVLGGGRGVGREAGLALAREGAKVVMTWFDWPEESAAMREELAALGPEHLAVRVDLREPEEVEKLSRTIAERYGSLDILVNNIERGGMPVLHGPYIPEQWDLEMDTTLKAKWWVFNAHLPLLKRNGGVVINVSSVAGIVGRSGPAGLLFNDGYAAANRAVSSFTETWARLCAPEVRVNEIMLGIFDSRHGELTRGWKLLTQEQRNAVLGQILTGRTGRADDFIKALFFLIRDADYMTGAVLRLDGGFAIGHSRVPPMPTGEAGVREDVARGGGAGGISGGPGDCPPEQTA